MRVLLASAELAPLVKVGGLAEAVGGLRAASLTAGVAVEAVIPDYAGLPLIDETHLALAVPAWAGPAIARRGRLEDGTPITLIRTPGIARPHPYVDGDGTGWTDNDARFMAFSAGVAALAEATGPDVVHLNDWHTGPVAGLLAHPSPVLLTIHNLAYQGITDVAWLDRLVRRPEAYEWWGDTNPLSGAIALADAVVTVSPTYAREILTPEFGAGLDGPLAARAGVLHGIRNGIDTRIWDPATDPHIPAPFHAGDVAGKQAAKAALCDRFGWDTEVPVAVMVTRLTDQKGVDLLFEADVATLPARVVLLGSGDRSLADAAAALAAAHPDRFAFVEGYEEPLSHLLFAGGDLLLMPSRFEPCGLNQMQAMRYGTIPVVSPVGGLLDTVTDADTHPRAGTGFVMGEVSADGLAEALERAVRAWTNPIRRTVITKRGMHTDWSWDTPAAEYLELYRALAP